MRCRRSQQNFVSAGERLRKVIKTSFVDSVAQTLRLREGECHFKTYFRRHREESAGLILAECCGTMGLSVTKNPNLSGRVCIPCSHKIRNAAELYRFVEEAISATEDVSCENRNKRLLLTTITAERIKGKKQVIEIGGDEREISPGKVNSRKTLFSQARDNSRLDSTSTEITSVCTLPEQEADDILTSLCNVEDHG